MDIPPAILNIVAMIRDVPSDSPDADPVHTCSQCYSSTTVESSPDHVNALCDDCAQEAAKTLAEFIATLSQDDGTRPMQGCIERLVVQLTGEQPMREPNDFQAETVAGLFKQLP